MIPRGADFPPNSAPPAKKREPATMRHDRPALPAVPPRAVRLPTGRRSAHGRGHTVLQRCAGRTQGSSPHSLRVMTSGVFGPATPRTATASISLLFSASSGPRPRAPIAWLRGPRPGKQRQRFLLPNALRRPRQSGKRPRFLQRTFLNFSTQKKEPARSQVGSLQILSLAAAFSLLKISSGRFPRGFGGAESVFRRFRS